MGRLMKTFIAVNVLSAIFVLGWSLKVEADCLKVCSPKYGEAHGLFECRCYHVNVVSRSGKHVMRRTESRGGER